ncbi:MAG TPA: MMPL family transporter [Kofleriaceae bacterium]
MTALALVVASIALIKFHLPLQADLSHLLPSDAPSVVDAQALASRMPAKDTMIAIVEAPDAATREEVVASLVGAITSLPPDLVDRVETDDDELRSYVGKNRLLFAPIEDLEMARDALNGDANKLEALRAKQKTAEARLAKSAQITPDGRMQVLVIRTQYRATDIDRDHRTLEALDRTAVFLEATHPGVKIGYAGGVPMNLAEHAALSRGIALSSAVTIVLVALVLLVYLRSLRMLFLLGTNILAATIVSFGLAAITIGHLNAATAFLGAIIAGNGINYGILLVARFLEERRTKEPEGALAAAIAGTLKPTLVASLGASIAYAALAVTRFRGFADFAWIGGAGMLACWICSFVLLPALLLRHARNVTHAPTAAFGSVVLKVFGSTKPLLVGGIAIAVTIACGAITYRYAKNDPFEYDMTQLRSQGEDAQQIHALLDLSDKTFGPGLAGMGGATFIAVDDPADLPTTVAGLDAIATSERIVGKVNSILDVVPQDQEKKLALLAQIRTQIDTLAPFLPEAQRAQLLAQRPSDDLRVLTAADVPPSVRIKLTERDGSVGKMIAVKPGANFDGNDGHDLIAFADAIRGARMHGKHLPATGASLLFADVLVQIHHDGPLVTAIAVIGLVIMVLLVVGRTRRAAAVLAATGAGTIAMIAACALVGLKVSFLDFVALPITLGLGIDYAINIADRAQKADPRTALRSTGGTVLVCSLTTVIGYASLMVSDNLAIRGFGLASLLGEITCVVAAFVIVPAVVSAHWRKASNPTTSTTQDAAISVA